MSGEVSEVLESAWFRRTGWSVLIASLAIGASLRIWLSFNDDGLYWPDEIYQSLEPAHRLVFGYGLIAWEFIQGARNWALPGLVAGLFKLSAFLGGNEPRHYLTVTRLFFSAVGLASAWGSYRLARSHGAMRLASACGASVFALAAPAIYFAPRAMSETTSALAVVLGFAFGLSPRSSRALRVLGASLLGLAVLIRLQTGIFCIGYLAILLARRQRREAIEGAVTLAVWAVFYGLLDRITWGGWFHSAIIYLRFNLIEGQASQWGTSKFGYYGRVLFTSMPVTTLLLVPLALLSWPKAKGVLLTALGFFLIHSLIPHKEFRFVLPVLPVLCGLAGIGLAEAWRRFPRPLPYALAIGLTGAASASAARFHALTFGELGQYEKLKPSASAYDDFGPVNRLLLAAHQQADLCGLKVEAVHLAWTGGETYLHRPGPLYPHFGPPRESGFFNYVITVRGVAGDGLVAAEGPFALVRLPGQGCIPDPGYQWRLP